MAAPCRITLLPVGLDRGAPTPLHRQLYQQLREAILSGSLAVDHKLPSSRALALELGVARNTVTMAYDALWGEGLISGARGAGTRINPLQTRRRTVGTAPRSPGAVRRTRSALMTEARSLLGTVPEPGSASRIFEVGVPTLDPQPLRLWLRATQRSARRWGANLSAADSHLGWAPGHPDLRRAIAAHLNAFRGMVCDPDHVVITSGSQGAIELAARLVLRSGDRVWVENPGYRWAVASIHAAGGVPVPVPVDADGLVIDEGLRRAPAARLAYVTPSHQFPTGVRMTLSRRQQLLGWATTNDAWILEDDYQSEFQYGGPPPASLHALDGNARVFYVGTFSTTLFPGIRLGYLVVPPDLAADAVLLQGTTGHLPSVPHQCVVAELLDSGNFARYVRRCRRLYRCRQEQILRLLRDLPPGCAVAPAGGGLHLVIWLPEGVQDTDCEAVIRAAGISLLPMSPYALEPLRRGALLLGFGNAPEAEIPVAVRTFMGGLRKALA